MPVADFLRNMLFPRSANKFLFILSPPYCGSTLLHEWLSTSQNISVNNSEGTREGQGLPGVREIMFDHDRRWDESLDFDWNFIKKEWMKHWDTSRPVLLEKSPPNLIRTRSIRKHFKPAWFIVLYRNPYAHCESLIRREKYSVEKSADFAVRCLCHQKKNLESLKHTLRLSYEELTDDPEKSAGRIREFLPELRDIRIKEVFQSHNFKNQHLQITNLNAEKLRFLTPENLEQIRTILTSHREILSYFGYDLLP